MQTSTNNSRRRSVPSINVTPLLDVLLILLVVLMLAMPMFVKRLPVDLPKTDLAGTPTPVKSLAVSLAKDGTVRVESSPIQAAALAALIKPETTVELSVDKDASYEQLAKLVTQVQAANPKEIILVTR